MRRIFFAVVVVTTLAVSVGSASANQLPILDSGPDESLPAGQTIEIQGSASDPDGDPLTISWILSAVTGDVLSCTFTEQDTTTPELSCTVPGQYLVQIVAFDGTDVLDDVGSVITFTEPVNTPPIVDSGPNRTGPVNTDLVMAGSATDPDGDPLTISWILTEISGDESSCTFTGTDTVTPTVNCAVAGTYLAQIGAGDGIDFSDDTGALVTFTDDDPIDDLTPPECVSTPFFGGWIQLIELRDPESGVADYALTERRRAALWFPPPPPPDPVDSLTLIAFGTSLFRSGGLVLEVTNGDGVAGSCVIRVSGLFGGF